MLFTQLHYTDAMLLADKHLKQSQSLMLLVSPVLPLPWQEKGYDLFLQGGRYFLSKC